MSLAADLKVLYHLTLSPIRGRSHAERLESFYQGQAEHYDSFRKRLLQGREQLYQSLEVPRGGVWVEMGGGTGANLENLGERIKDLSKVYVVDLSKSLLEVARQRAEARGWTNLETVEADATAWMPPAGADMVTFSYSLTMIPDWFAAIDQAHRILKPGGRIGVVDFYVSRKYAEAGHKRHPWFVRSFWPVWFGMDNVHPSADHVPYLHRRFAVEQFNEHLGRVPYILWPKMPYYQFVGRKEGGEAPAATAGAGQTATAEAVPDKTAPTDGGSAG
jgi:S-adenosylmethionine-diacylgycerolhomoserine-N-methlytransferase